MRVLCLTKYTATGPSSRYRILQFLPALRDAGFDLHIQSLHDDSYLESMFSGQRPSRAYLVRRMMARAAALVQVRRFDLVFIQKEIFPYLAPIAESWISRMRVPYVLDFDDAIHLLYQGRQRLVKKMPTVIAAAALVLAGNRHLARYARRFNPRTLHFPTVVDTDRFACGPRSPREIPVVGWMGSPETVAYLDALLPAFRHAWKIHPFELRVVGATLESVEPPATSSRWSYEAEVSDLRGMDVGVMPLPDSEWSDGKCALKLLQYMSAGLPTVSTPRGSVPDIIMHGENGFVADAPGKWTDVLAEACVRSRDDEEIGRRARATVVDHYSLHVWAPRLVRALMLTGQRRGVPADVGILDV